MKRRGIVILFAVLLSACNLRQEPEPTAVVVPTNPPNLPTLAISTESADVPTSTPSETPVIASPTPTNTSVMIIAPSETIADNTSTPTPAPTITQTPSITPTPAPNGQVAPERGGLRLRVRPSTSGEIMTTLDELTQLFIHGRTGDNNWFSITTAGGQSGWVMSRYVELYVDMESLPVLDPNTVAAAPPVSPTATPDLTGADGYVLAEGDGLRLRALPSVNADIVLVMPENSPMEIIGRTPDNIWLQVQVSGGKTGWVYAEYVVVQIDLASVGIPEEAFAPTPEAYVSPSMSAAAGGLITGITSNSTQIFLRGQQMGNRPNVFTKVGDSNTHMLHFLHPIGWGRYNLGEHAYLQPVINYFMGATARDSNSFNNQSFAVRGGWTTVEVLNPANSDPGVCQPGETPLACEYRVVKPSISIIMIGTNDVGLDTELYAANLRRIVEISIEMGVIPVLSTIPQRVGWEWKVGPYNQIIINTARTYDIPLMDYYTVMSTLPNMGLDVDGTHPSWVGAYENFEASGQLTPENLKYGFPMRNLLTLQTLDVIWRQVIAPNQQ